MRLTIYGKMMLGFALIILVMILANAYLLSQLEVLSATIHTVLSSGVRAIDAARQISPLLDDEERHARKFLATADTLYYGLYSDVATQVSLRLDSLRTRTRGTEDIAFLLPAAMTHAALLDSLAGARQAQREQRTFRLGQDDVGDSIAAIRAHIDAYASRTERSITAAVSGLDESVARSLSVAMIVTLATFAAAIVGAFLIARTITRPLNVLRAGTRRVARGDFRPISVRSRDEIAQLASAFNTMSARLKLSNDQRTEMLHQISHEIRTPLQSIYSAYHLLSNQIPGPVTEGQQKLLETVRNNVDRIADFSNRFLDLARIESGMMTFSFQARDLADVIAPAVESARVSGAARGIRIRIETRPAPRARIDTDTMLQVIGNLLTNALKYTASGGEVTVEVGPSETGVRLSVHDTGVGIPAEDLPKLFRKFSQASNTAVAGSRGSGLGLAMVKAIVEAHGGTVGVTSTLGQGSTFTVDLPAAPQATGAAGDDAQRKEAAS